MIMYSSSRVIVHELFLFINCYPLYLGRSKRCGQLFFIAFFLKAAQRGQGYVFGRESGNNADRLSEVSKTAGIYKKARLIMAGFYNLML